MVPPATVKRLVRSSVGEFSKGAFDEAKRRLDEEDRFFSMLQPLESARVRRFEHGGAALVIKDLGPPEQAAQQLTVEEHEEFHAAYNRRFAGPKKRPALYHLFQIPVYGTVTATQNGMRRVFAIMALVTQHRTGSEEETREKTKAAEELAGHVQEIESAGTRVPQHYEHVIVLGKTTVGRPPKRIWVLSLPFDKGA